MSLISRSKAAPSGHVGQLTEEQSEKLDLFRMAVEDIMKPDFDDYYLLRWLRARKFDVVKAEIMLRKHVQWRQHLQVDNVLDDFDPPEPLRKFYPGGLVGHDREGSPVWIIPLGNVDIKGLFHSCKKMDFIRYTVKMMQESEEDIIVQSERLGVVIETHSFILDMERFDMKQLAWKPAADIVTGLITMFEDHYPERLKKIYVINAPKYFPLAYNLVKPFLAEETAAKIYVYSDYWREKLLLDINENELPAHWGGSKVDLIDHDPRCPSLVCPGGQVPASLYMAPSRRLSADQSLEIITVDKKKFVTVEKIVTQPGTTLKWEFKTEDNDIGFCLYRQRQVEELKGINAGDDEDDVIPFQRVNCHLVPEDGEALLYKPGRYIFKFDNSYSWYTSKRVMFIIQVIPPIKVPGPDGAGGDKAKPVIKPLPLAAASPKKVIPIESDTKKPAPPAPLKEQLESVPAQGKERPIMTKSPKATEESEAAALMRADSKPKPPKPPMPRADSLAKAGMLDVVKGVVSLEKIPSLDEDSPPSSPNQKKPEPKKPTPAPEKEKSIDSKEDKKPLPPPPPPVVAASKPSPTGSPVKPKLPEKTMPPPPPPPMAVQAQKSIDKKPVPPQKSVDKPAAVVAAAITAAVFKPAVATESKPMVPQKSVDKPMPPKPPLPSKVPSIDKPSPVSTQKSVDKPKLAEKPVAPPKPESPVKKPDVPLKPSEVKRQESIKKMESKQEPVKTQSSLKKEDSVTKKEEAPPPKVVPKKVAPSSSEDDDDDEDDLK